MGLTEPRDLDRWRARQAAHIPMARRLLRAGRAALQPGRAERTPIVVHGGGAPGGVLIVLDSTNVTSRLALLAPARQLPRELVTIVAPSSLEAALPASTWPIRSASAQALDQLAAEASVTLSTGHYLELGGRAYAAATRRGRAFVTVQHGLLTPAAPPLAPDTQLLAWSAGDGEFWAAGRSDIRISVTGSQLLYEAAASPSPAPSDGPPLYLGQLHGAELPFEGLARSAEAFCLAEHAAYRPHPSETDRRSRATHQRWESLGIAIDRSGTPLTALNRPVVSAFSTGVLEAAARGVPAWVHFLDPPPWLTDFWERYGMHPWGMPPSPPPPISEHAPAQQVAECVLAIGGLT